MTTAVETPSADSSIEVPDSKLKFLRSPFFQVVALTILAGVLRFSFLDRPPIWGDEAMTYMRVSGTYQQMLDALQDWGFAPLHYELYWWMRQHWTLTPFMMRLPTAIAGTLMVPAMYWLAVQLVGRKVALVAALFTACSAYLCNYSRDAKMYIDFWFFCVLNFACLLWWLRVRTRIAWWCWVASGVAMMGLNLLGGIILGIELLALLLWPGSRPPREWKWYWRILHVVARPILFGLGIAIMAAGPYGYYRYFNRYAEKVDRQGMLGAGLSWVEEYNRGRDAVDLVLFTSTAHLYSWEWPRLYPERNIDDQKDVNPTALRWLKIAGITLLSVLALGLLPWPRKWTGFAVRKIGMSPFPKAEKGDIPIFRRWFAAALLAAWIVLPSYAFYCMSMRRCISPPEVVLGALYRPGENTIDWQRRRKDDAATKLSAAWEQLKSQVQSSNLRKPTTWWHWSLLIAGFAVAAAAIAAATIMLNRDTMRPLLLKAATALLIAVGLFLVCTGIYIYVILAKKYSGSIWMPRYLGILWPALAIVVAILLLRLPTRPLRWAAIALLVGVNLSVFSARVFAGSEPPVPLMAQDMIDSQPADTTVRIYYAVRVNRAGAPGTGYLLSVPGAYYLTTLSGRATAPDEMLSAFFGGRFERKWPRWTPSVVLGVPQSIANDLRRRPHIERIMVWENFRPEKYDDSDPVAEKLGADWRRVGEQIFPVRDHWTWRNLMTVRRRVYERTEGPTTQPTTVPNTASFAR